MPTIIKADEYQAMVDGFPSVDRLLLDEQRLLRVVPAADLQAIDPMLLRLWCHRRAVYQLPTIELIEWLRAQIGERSAIEICAGHGAIGRALGVTATDSAVQTTPELRAYYSMLGQPIVDPPPDVQRMEASQAVWFHKPEIVFGAWVTQKYRNECGPNQDASVWGVHEEQILAQVKKYIVIGNVNSHGRKWIMRRPHETLSPSWLVSRAEDPQLNRIWIWKGDR